MEASRFALRLQKDTPAASLAATRPLARAGDWRRAAMPRAARPRACGARRADRTRRQQSAGRWKGPIPPGAAPWKAEAAGGQDAQGKAS